MAKRTTIKSEDKPSSLDTIHCPRCGTAIPVSEALQQQLTEKTQLEVEGRVNAEKLKMEGQLEEARKKYEAENKRQQEAISAREKALKEKEKNIDEQVEEKLKADKAKLEKEAIKKAEADVSLKIKNLQAQVGENEKKLEIAQKAELDLLKEKRELEAAKKEFELEMARKLDKERDSIREYAMKKADDEHRLKDAEKDKKIQEILALNEELKRKAQQGSQQTQGEVLEIEVEKRLKSAFRDDDIEPVSKGIKGADVVQRVCNQSGHSCGIIVWEAKNTNSWRDSWIDKVKEDQRDAKADLAVIVTKALPKDVANFEYRNDVWITNYESYLALAGCIRINLIQISAVKRFAVGKNEKLEILYNYLTSPDFRHKVMAVIEAGRGMQDDLVTEKRAFTKIWAKRESKIEQIMHSMAGMYGDLEGHIGKQMQPIPALELIEDKERKSK